MDEKTGIMDFLLLKVTKYSWVEEPEAPAVPEVPEVPYGDTGLLLDLDVLPEHPYQVGDLVEITGVAARQLQRQGKHVTGRVSKVDKDFIYVDLGGLGEEFPVPVADGEPDLRYTQATRNQRRAEAAKRLGDKDPGQLAAATQRINDQQGHFREGDYKPGD